MPHTAPLPECDETHGEDSPHELVHEAGHALSSWCWGIRILRVEFFAPGTAPPIGDPTLGEVCSARVLTSPDPSVWTPMHPEAGAHFHFAGLAAENAAFGHHSGGAHSDMELLKARLRLSSLFADDLDHEVKAVLGIHSPGTYAGEVTAWAVTHRSALSRLCQVLAQAQGGGVVSGDEIQDVLGNDSCGRANRIF